MPQAEYVGISQITGPFILLENIGRAAFYGELVDVRVPGGKIRRGRVVSLSEKATLIQVFSGTDNLVPNDTRVRLLGRALQVQLAPSILGRTFNGFGEPADGCGPVFGGKRIDAIYDHFSVKHSFFI